MLYALSLLAESQFFLCIEASPSSEVSEMARSAEDAAGDAGREGGVQGAAAAAVGEGPRMCVQRSERVAGGGGGVCELRRKRE
jgi:hypothetical protein